MSLVIASPVVSKPHSGLGSPWFTQVLATADIELNGSRPWDIQLKHPHTLQRWMREGSLGLGESYMDGWWECQAIDQMMSRAMAARLHQHLGTAQAWWHSCWSRWSQPRTQGRTSIVGRAQYDFSNALFTAMLDRGLNHGSASWEDGAETLEQAQEAKLEKICQQLKLQPGMRLLDLGCGWGALMRHAAKYHGVSAVGLSHDSQQVQLGISLTKGLPVQLERLDARQFNIDGRSQFDRVVSLGVLTQMNKAKDPAIFSAARRSLKPHGWCLIEAMGNNQPDALLGPWQDKHVFRQQSLPHIDEMTQLAQAHFEVQALHNLGEHHDRTLLHWHQRFELAWPQLRLQHDERFYRLWRYHLLASAGSCRAKQAQVWQFTLSPKGSASA